MSTKDTGKAAGVQGPDFTQGIGGLAAGDNSQFQVGSLGGGPQPMAGLTGIASGMSGSSGPAPDLTTGTQQYQFTLPSATNSTPNTQMLGQSLGMGAALTSPGSAPQTAGRGGAGGGVRAQVFTPNLADAVAAGGSQNGSGLLQLLQKYQVGR